MQNRCKQGMMVALMVSAMLLSWQAAMGQHEATMVLTSGQSARGMVRFIPATGNYEISVQGATREIRASDVAEIRLTQPPAQLDEALRNVELRRYQQAVPVLSRIVEEYVMLGPDLQAGNALMLAHLRTNRAGEALRTAETLIRRNPNLERNAEFATLYWEALMAENRISSLRTHINDAVQRGPRDLAAVALLRRGDIEVREGRHREALIDGYLRVVLMFRDVGLVQPEALYKAIRAHEELNEIQYADRWRQRLLSEFATSEFAQRLRD